MVSSGHRPTTIQIHCFPHLTFSINFSDGIERLHLTVQTDRPISQLALARRSRRTWPPVKGISVGFAQGFHLAASSLQRNVRMLENAPDTIGQGISGLATQ